MKARSTLAALAAAAGLVSPVGGAGTAQAAPADRREPGRPTGYIVVYKDSVPDVDAATERHGLRERTSRPELRAAG